VLYHAPPMQTAVPWKKVPLVLLAAHTRTAYAQFAF
jgi:hypothetical protein